VTKVAVIGQGYVGLPIAISAAKSGYEVLGFDTNQSITNQLNLGSSHISDISNEELNSVLSMKNFRASSNPNDLRQVEIVVIAVPTPLDSQKNPDLTFIKSACETLAKELSASALIINESTSYPGTLRNFIMPLLSKSETVKHLYAISPERVDPGNKKWNVENTPRLYSGITKEASDKTRDFYSKFCSNLVEVSSPEVAEAAKLFENTFRQVNIALVNEFSNITRSLGISVREVLDAATTKPYGFMRFNPGIGVGGHCIPVDPSYLAFAAQSVGASAEFIELANKVNLEMPNRIADRIIAENGGSISGKEILVCGLSYKSNTPDVRESPSILLINKLRNEGAIVVWHDPLVANFKDETSSILGNKKFDITILASFHDVMDLELISQSSDYIFDCLGLIENAVQL
jgi:UDP-N-acetyl-D-glucosamine dehydrogenase